MSPQSCAKILSSTKNFRAAQSNKGFLLIVPSRVIPHLPEGDVVLEEHPVAIAEYKPGQLIGSDVLIRSLTTK